MWGNQLGRCLEEDHSSYILFCFELDRNPDVAEQSKVFNVYPRRNSRTYPSFQLQLEKNQRNDKEANQQ